MTLVLLQLSKRMAIVLLDIAKYNGKADIGWYNRLTLNALKRRRLIRFTGKRISLTYKGEIIIKLIK